MEAFEQLEQHVTALLARLETLKAENARLRAEMDTVSAGLKEENRRLTSALEQEEALRTDVLKRVDSLLQKIQEHNSVE